MKLSGIQLDMARETTKSIEEVLQLFNGDKPHQEHHDVLELGFEDKPFETVERITIKVGDTDIIELKWITKKA